MIKRILTSARGRTLLWALAIVALSAALGMLVEWRAPGIGRYAQDWLTRARGPLPVPDDIALVAIDEPSIQRLGRFPWPRSVIARAIDAVSAAQPKAVALDVLFTDRTTSREDDALAQSIAAAGNVVAAAQLADAPHTAAEWLLPLPEIARAAATTGHVNVLTESDGVARELLIRAADASGKALYAMPVEAVRIAEGIPERAITHGRDTVLLGHHAIPVEHSAPVAPFSVTRGSVALLDADRMAIDYIGPSGAFANRTYSLADVLDGRIPAARFHGRYVLIGATAASLGDRLSSPFMHDPDLRGDQHGSPMPGVEVLANALNTVLRSRFYTTLSDPFAFLLAALSAALTLSLLGWAQGRGDALKQLAALVAAVALIVLASYLAFTRLLLVPPLVPCLVAFASAGILGLLRRSLAAGAAIDAGLAQLAEAGRQLAPAPPPASIARSIASLTEATAVAVFSGDAQHPVVAFGPPLVRHRRGGFRLRDAPPHSSPLHLEPLTGGAGPGMLVLALPSDGRATGPALELAKALAAAALAAPRDDSSAENTWWPRGLEARARRLGRLNASIVDRSRFVEQALGSVDDGLIIAGPDATITFANRAAEHMLNGSPLPGSNLLQHLAAFTPALDPGEALQQLLLQRTPLEREIAIAGARPRYCMLRLAAVCGRDEGSPALGLVAALSDITRQHELQRTKNDVISLVSHEMRTPLTAIQGMTELLAAYEIDADRRREMHLAINDEVKRLTRMISGYLDITRLEAGASPVRRVPARIEPLLERTLLLLEPLAAQRRIRIHRALAPGLPPLLADPDLLSRAIDNLVSNAIKYSPPDTVVEVSANTTGATLSIEIADQGYGIPPADRERIFEKFYRIPRVQDAGVPGTGLGLAFVREIALLHGGSITVESARGGGSLFILRLPSG